MKRKTLTFVPIGRGSGLVVAVLLAASIALLLFALPATAQGTGTGASAVAKNGNATAKAGDGSPARAVAGNATAVAGTAAQGQYGTQAPRISTRTAAQATNPLADKPAEIANTNGGNDVNTVGPIDAGCALEVEPDATVVVEDQNGQQITISNSSNDFTLSDDKTQLTITGPGGEDIVADGVGSIASGTGRVVSSTGITCGDNGGGTGGGKTQDGACTNPKEVAAVGPTTDNTRTPFKVTGSIFRVSYDVTFEDPDALFNSLDIDIEDRFGLAAFEIVDESGRDSFIVTEGPGSFELVVNVTPNNGATYTITVEDCTSKGDPSDPGDVVDGTTPKGELADTGGVSLIPILFVLGLSLAGAGLLLRASLVRER